MNKNIFTVTIGIPAYNEEKNIANVLTALVDQKEAGFTLEQIIVYSDMSTDKTDAIVESYPDKRIKLIRADQRAGQFMGIKNIIQYSKSDITILIDADVIITDNNFVSHIVRKFRDKDNVGLVGANRKIYEEKTFAQKCVATSIRAYDNIALSLNNGDNPYNCHGAVLAVHRDFAKSIDYPAEIFSGDTYLYFACISHGYKFKFAYNAVYAILLPKTLTDTIKQYKRFLDIDYVTITKYQAIIDPHYKVKKIIRIKYLLKELLLHPIYTISMFLLIQYCKRSKSVNSATWSIATTTKGVNNK